MVETYIREQADGRWTVLRNRGGNGWGIGAEFATEEQAQNVADIIEHLSNSDVEVLTIPLSIGDTRGEYRYQVEITLQHTEDGPLLSLAPVNCKLEGELPGEYYLVPEAR